MSRRPYPSLVLALVAVGCNADLYRVSPVSGRTVGQVVDMDGNPLGGASVTVLEGGTWGREVQSDAQGWFETDKLQGNHWIRVEADGYLPRVRATSPSEQALFRLSESDGSIVRLVFAGSTTFGPGFYEPDRAGAIRSGHEVNDTIASLSGVLPLLEGVQLANLALEGPLSVHPEQHPEKSAVYRNHPTVAPALAYAGFDFVHLANDHSYDLLEHGMVETQAHLEAAGLSHQGTGLDEAEAWEPAFRDVGAVRLALLGCTTVTGSDYTIGFVADDSLGRGGAAGCDRDQLDAQVAFAAEQADVTVVQIHGGQALDPTPSQAVADHSERAAQGGAKLVINHHPRVNGGLSMVGDALVVESLGALATDLALWETFPSALLEVHVDHDGIIQRAFIEPLLRDSLRPMAVVGWPRTRIARDVLAASSAVVALDGGALEVDLQGRSVLEERQLDIISTGGGWSQPVDLRDGWLSEVQGTIHWQVGRDLLRVGDFEDIDADDDMLEGFLWTLDSSYEWISDQAAYSGDYGLRLSRDASHTDPVWTHPAHRIPVPQDQALSVAGQIRSRGTVELQVSWYESTAGESFERSYYELETSGDWAPFDLELEVPRGAQAANLYIKLHPPERGRAHADIDALRLVSWAPEHPDDTTPYDTLRVQGDASYTLRRRVMPVLNP